MARHRADQSGWIWAGAAFLVMLGTASAAWADHLSDEGRVVAGNISFAGRDVSRLGADQALDVVEERAGELLSTPIGIESGSSRLVLPADELGFGYDTEAAFEAVLSARHTGGPVAELSSFVTAPFQPVSIRDFITFDAEAAIGRLAGDPRLVLQEAVEPVVEIREGELVVVPGVPGRQIDLEALTDRLAKVGLTAGPADVDIGQGSIPPTVSDDAAGTVVDRVNSITSGGALLLVGTTTAWMSASQLREHITVMPGEGSVRVTFDTLAFHSRLEQMLPDPVAPFSPPEFEVVGGEVRVVAPGEVPPVCCQLQSVQNAVDALMAGGPGPHRLESRPSDDPRLVAMAMGSDVVEVVGEFTTHHACCEARVTNIHRIADLVKGAYLAPGETISINEHVGPRTRAKGFVPAGAIRFGRLTPEVGGGVSQFATTIFNAAYFAGLDLVEYRSHSLYFSRYPFGREATISNPHPDLVFHNGTDYPVLIWASYTPTSITVTMYSTKHIEVEELGQRVFRRNLCRHVETDRQRTFPDGRVVVDTIVADYRPAEGIDCNGDPIPIPPGA